MIKKISGKLRTLGELLGENKDTSESLEERENVDLTPPFHALRSEDFIDKTISKNYFLKFS